jgi:hypothetical protein
MSLAAWLVVACLATVALVCVPLYLIYRKLSAGIDRLAKQLPKECGNLFAQVEALTAIYRELNLKHALPPTRGWAASPDFLRNIMTHALRIRPTCIVECSSGVSTIVLARCVQILGTGHVHSLEHDPEFAEQTRQLLRSQGLADFATVYDAPLRELTLPGWSGRWYSSDVLPRDLSIDLLVIDGPPWFVGELPRYPAVPVFFDALVPGATAFLDDADRPEEQVIVKRWREQFTKLESIQVPKCEKGCVALVRKS